MNRVISQSFAVSEEEKLAVEVLAAGEGIKPGAFVRHMFYRGLSQYIGEPGLKSAEEEAEAEAEIFGRALKLIADDENLSRLKKAVVTLKESPSRPARLYATPNTTEESKKATKDTAKKTAGKARRR